MVREGRKEKERGIEEAEDRRLREGRENTRRDEWQGGEEAEGRLVSKAAVRGGGEGVELMIEIAVVGHVCGGADEPQCVG